MPKRLTHIKQSGAARMVDVSPKDETARVASATGKIQMQGATVRAIMRGSVAKGDVLAVARVAALQGLKRTSDLIPLCHPLRVTGADVEIEPSPRRGTIQIRAEVRAHDRTGVEMEALTAVSVAALTIYDMAKAIDRGMVISEIRLEAKRGGKSGTWQRK